MTNAAGANTYSIIGTIGLNSGTNQWVILGGGTSPGPTSYFTNVDASTLGTVDLGLAKSYNGSNNWTQLGKLLTAIGLPNGGWTVSNAPIDLGAFGYVCMYGLTNTGTNGAALTNAFLRAYHK